MRFHYSLLLEWVWRNANMYLGRSYKFSQCREATEFYIFHILTFEYKEFMSFCMAEQGVFPRLLTVHAEK